MSCISEIFKQSGEFERLAAAKGAKGVLGAADAVKAPLIHALMQTGGGKALVLTPDEASAVRMCENLSALQSGVVLYPSREFTFEQVTGVSREFEHIRLGALAKLLSGECTAVVCSVNAACQFTAPPQELKKRTLKLKTGAAMPLSELAQRLVYAGYSRYDQVDGVSQFAIRGGIADIFPPGNSEPVRLEFWGDTIDTISTFDPVTQRRTGKIAEMEIIPATEVLFDSNEKFAKSIEKLSASLRGKAVQARKWLDTDSENLKKGILPACCDKYLPLAYASNGIFDYFGAEDALFVCESAKVKERGQNSDKLWRERIKFSLQDMTLCKGLDKFCLDFEELKAFYEKLGAVYLDSLPRGSFDTPVSCLADLNTQSFNRWSGKTAELEEELRPLLKNKYTVCIMAGTARSARALANDLNDDGIFAVFADGFPPAFQKGAVTVTTGTMSAGFRIADMKFALITHTKALVRQNKRRKSNSKNAIHSLDELSVGDYIVHNVHGIGVFEGIQALEMNKIKKDNIKISYAKGDSLYVPVNQLDLVTKYIGHGDNTHFKQKHLRGR